MPERSLEGIQITETPGAEQPIARASAHLTAFVGRTLRGPVNRPILMQSFADFQQQFGGLWQPSPLSYADRALFRAGRTPGRSSFASRTALRPSLFPCAVARETLQLEARAPGTREFLRASIDYDHLDADDEQRFNLVVQRVRSPGSERIETQETFRALSIDPESPRFVAGALLESNLVRVRGAVPSVRPDRTLMPGTNLPVGLRELQSGRRRRPPDQRLRRDRLRDASLRAVRARGSVDELAFLYIPPLTRTADVGVSTVLVAAKFCRQRRAMLIVDPPAAWDSAAEAVRGLKRLNFHSDHALMFFPRIAATDRLRGRTEMFGNGGAVAGMLSRTGEAVSAAIAAQDPEPLLRAGTRLAREVASADRWSLAAHGVNVLHAVRSADRERPPLRTLACGASASSDWSYLSQRRFALFVINSIERGTRWCVLPSRRSAGVGTRRDASAALPGRAAERRRFRVGAGRPGVLRDLRRAHQRSERAAHREHPAAVRGDACRRVSQLHDLALA